MLKDGVHLLPYNQERLEFFMWLHQEIKSLGGEMHFTLIERFETLSNDDIKKLFQTQADSYYSELEQKIKQLNSQFTISDNDISINEQNYQQVLKRLVNDFEEIYATDFFKSHNGQNIKKSLQMLKEKFEDTSLSKIIIKKCNLKEYQHRIWQTRKKPFVDRMASAWLISRYIDSYAQFIFDDEIDNTKEHIVTYDMNEATFTHQGDLCTFEVLLYSFDLNDDVLKAMSKIIHNIDLNDDKFITPQAEGIKLILSTIRNSEEDDNIILEKSYTIFDYLYLALK